MKRVIVSADDFGLSEGVNEAVERACRDGVLSTASLMVSGPAAADAVARARRLPRLRVGLHLVVIEGASARPGQGAYGSGQFGLGVAHFVRRRRLAAEIRAQYEAFARTGLRLDHANAHKHMHMHPTVGRMLIEIGREFRLPAVRVPREPMNVLRRCGTEAGLGARAMNWGSAILRWRARRAGMQVNDNVFGLAWSGHMTEGRLLQLIPHLPEGLSEVYFHPATRQDGDLARLMPGYEPAGELAALLSLRVRTAFAASGVALVRWGEP